LTDEFYPVVFYDRHQGKWLSAGCRSAMIAFNFVDLNDRNGQSLCLIFCLRGLNDSQNSHILTYYSKKTTPARERSISCMRPHKNDILCMCPHKNDILCKRLHENDNLCTTESLSRLRPLTKERGYLQLVQGDWIFDFAVLSSDLILFKFLPAQGHHCHRRRWCLDDDAFQMVGAAGPKERVRLREFDVPDSYSIP